MNILKILSRSDNGTYADFCYKAATDSKTFANFRRNKEYQKILEHVNREQGRQYLDAIGFKDDLAIFKENDEWGNPEVFYYAGYGEFSPTTLRYIKVLSDLSYIFSTPFEGFNIAEIGVGYGGQCRVISSVHKTNYTLIDIKPALMLAERYLSNFSLRSTLNFKTMNELESKEYDLVISNYAFSELPRNIQEIYLNKVILNSKRGYMTMNFGNDFDSYTKEELLALIPNSREVAEEPLTHNGNCIIVWGDVV